MAGQEADAPQPVDFVDGAEQVGQVRLVAGVVVAIAIHDLAQQRHLAHALVHQAPYFTHDLVQRPAALDAAAERDDAEGAGVEQPYTMGTFAAMGASPGARGGGCFAGGWKLEAGSWKLEVGSWKLT